MNKHVLLQSRPTKNSKPKKRRWMKRKQKTTAFGEQLKEAIGAVSFGTEAKLVDEGDVKTMDDIIKRRSEVRK